MRGSDSCDRRSQFRRFHATPLSAILTFGVSHKQLARSTALPEFLFFVVGQKACYRCILQPLVCLLQENGRRRTAAAGTSHFQASNPALLRLCE